MSAVLVISWKVRAEISRVRRPHFRVKTLNNSEVKSLTRFGQLVGVWGQTWFSRFLASCLCELSLLPSVIVTLNFSSLSLRHASPVVSVERPHF